MNKKKLTNCFVKIDCKLIGKILDRYSKAYYQPCSAILGIYINNNKYFKFYSGGKYGFFDCVQYDYKELTILDLLRQGEYVSFEEALKHMKAGGRCKYESDPDEYYITSEYYEHGEIVAENSHGIVQDIFMTCEMFDKKWILLE